MKTLLLLIALVWSQFAQAQSTCTPYSSIMYGGGVYATGSATVSNDGTNLIIDLASDSANGWHMSAVNIYAGPGPIPQTNGFPEWNLFPYIENFGALEVDVKQYSIPLADLGTSCNGDPIYVAIYAAMIRVDADGNILQYENAWAYGPNVFSGNHLAWWFDYTPCCQVACTGCTRSQGYYKNNSVYTKKTPQPWPISENTQLCGKKWYDIIKATPKSGDAWTILAQQWITAMLNAATGASTGAMVDTALSDSQTMLTNNCAVLPKGEIERQLALEYKLVLENYNKGVIGPGSCPNE